MSNIRGRLAKLEREQPPPPPGEPTVTVYLPKKDGDTGGPPVGERIEGNVRWVTYVAEHQRPAT